MREYPVINVVSAFYIIIVVAKIFHEIEEHGECVLSYGLRGVSGHIAPFDSAFRKIVFVQVVGARGGDADQLQVLRAADRGFIDQNLVHHCYVRVRDRSGTSSEEENGYLITSPSCSNSV